MLIEGTPAIAYGVPCVTKDIDIFLFPTLDSAERCLKALAESGLRTSGLTTAREIFDTEVTIFKDVVRFDILSKVKGIEFPDAWRRRVSLSLRGIDIPTLHLAGC